MKISLAIYISIFINSNLFGDWRLATGDWRLATGDWRLATGDCFFTIFADQWNHYVNNSSY
jgi:hypothetical protein